MRPDLPSTQPGSPIARTHRQQWIVIGFALALMPACMAWEMLSRVSTAAWEAVTIALLLGGAAFTLWCLPQVFRPWWTRIVPAIFILVTELSFALVVFDPIQIFGPVLGQKIFTATFLVEMLLFPLTLLSMGLALAFDPSEAPSHH